MFGVLRAHPERLRGVAVVEPATPFDELRLLADAGIRGLRLNLVGLPMPDLSRPVWQTLLQHVRVLDWHVELHRPSQDLAAAGQPVLDRLSRELAAVLREPDVRTRLEGMGAEVIGSTPAELDAFRRAQIAKWTQVAKTNRIALD